MFNEINIKTHFRKSGHYFLIFVWLLILKSEKTDRELSQDCHDLPFEEVQKGHNWSRVLTNLLTNQGPGFDVQSSVKCEEHFAWKRARTKAHSLDPSFAFSYGFGESLFRNFYSQFHIRSNLMAWFHDFKYNVWHQFYEFCFRGF